MALPMHRAPARRSCSTHTACATAVGCESRHVGLPQPVLQPTTSITSLTAKQSPSSEPLPLGDRSNVVTKALLSLTVIVDLFIPANVCASWFMRAGSSRTDEVQAVKGKRWRLEAVTPY